MQIDYTARDYEALKSELVALVNKRTDNTWDASNPSDLGAVLLEAFAYMGDIMSYYLDRAANETSVTTAVKTSTLLNFASLYGFKPSGPTPAQVDVSFTNNGSSNIDLPIGTQVMAPLTYGKYTEVYFETTQAIVQLEPDQTVTVTAREGKTANTDRPDLISQSTFKPLPVSLGTSSGTADQTFQIFDTGIIDDSIVVYVGQGVAFSSWSYRDSFSDAGPTDLVFTTKLNENGTVSIIFGDGVNGLIPTANQLISCLYKTSTGASGNVVAESIQEVTFVPGNGDPEAISYVKASNVAAAFGGADPDDTTQLRKKIKAAMIARKRAVTLDDYEYLALQASLVGRAKGVAATPSSVTLYVQSQNDNSITPGVSGGLPTVAWSKVKANVETYLADKIPVGTTLTVSNPTYVSLFVKMNLVIDNTYKQTAVKLEIAKALLNSGGLFSYEQNEFGRLIPASAVTAVIQGIPGVKSVELVKLNTTDAVSVGTITLADNQIPYLLPTNLTYGTVTGGIPPVTA